MVLYRAVLHVGMKSQCTRVVSHVQDWTSSGEASIAIQGNRLRVDPDCMVEIESLTSLQNVLQLLLPHRMKAVVIIRGQL